MSLVKGWTAKWCFLTCVLYSINCLNTCFIALGLYYSVYLIISLSIYDKFTTTKYTPSFLVIKGSIFVTVKSITSRESSLPNFCLSKKHTFENEWLNSPVRYQFKFWAKLRVWVPLLIITYLLLLLFSINALQILVVILLVVFQFCLHVDWFNLK